MWLALVVDVVALSVLTVVAGASDRQTWTVAYFVVSVATKSANVEPWGSVLVRTFAMVALSVGCVGLSRVQLSRSCGTARIPGALDRIEHALTQSSQLLRSTVTELHPAVLRQAGLARALRDLAGSVAQRGHLTVAAGRASGTTVTVTVPMS